MTKLEHKSLEDSNVMLITGLEKDCNFSIKSLASLQSSNYRVGVGGAFFQGKHLNLHMLMYWLLLQFREVVAVICKENRAHPGSKYK